MVAGVRWLVALSAVVLLAAGAGAGSWWLTAFRWHWSRADVIPTVGIVVAAVVALGVVPAQAWASSRNSVRAVRVPRPARWPPHTQAGDAQDDAPASAEPGRDPGRWASHGSTYVIRVDKGSAGAAGPGSHATVNYHYAPKSDRSADHRDS